MYVLGTIHIESFNGEKWDIEVELKATDGEGFQLLGNQAFVFTIFFIVLGAWFATSVFPKKRSSGNEHNEYVVDNHEFLPGDHL